jgi:hypothetical protein
MQTMDPQVAAKLPQYQSHKKVRASKIKAIQKENNNQQNGPAYLILEAEGFPPLFMEAQWMQRFTPEVGQMLVVYDDGYMSISPAKPFDEGHTSIK